MTNRRTSAYTIRLAQPDAHALDEIRTGLRLLGVPVTDHGVTSLSFRSANDMQALTTAKAACVRVNRSMSLTTGLGVHRRTVTA